MTITGAGITIVKTTAVAATTGNNDTQQISVDNHLVPEMRCAVGPTRTKGAADIVR